MAIIHAEHLKSLVVKLFETVDVDPVIARRAADHLVEANLAGVDSHGVMRMPDYIEQILVGGLARTDKIEVLRDFAAVALWDGHLTIGQYMAWLATEKAIEKAAAFGIGMVSARHSGHIGRLGEYAAQMANAGYIGYVTANLQGFGQRVAPFGGKYARLGTNPHAWGVPTGGVPMVIDMSTSVSAEGRIRVKMRRGETLPQNWLLDNQGNPTTNPADLYGPPHGALLTTGGHKGYGLSLVAEALAGLLNGGGYPRNTKDVLSLENGFAVIAIHIDAFGPLDEFQTKAAELMNYMKATPPADGVAEVMYPNEPETRERARRLANGIPIEDESWNLIVATANKLNIPVPEVQ
ncbi:MAG: Ldh family oxidoreductase [Anaerolineae bacterium]|nr:Ldh family oxidoreductase [Anaerolineae bacterium]